MFGPFLPLGHSLICLQKWLATRSSGASERVFGWKTCTLLEYMLTQQQPKHLVSQQGSVLQSSPTLAESQVRLGELFGVSFSFSLQVGTLELCLKESSTIWAHICWKSIILNSINTCLYPCSIKFQLLFEHHMYAKSCSHVAQIFQQQKICSIESTTNRATESTGRESISEFWYIKKCLKKPWSRLSSNMNDTFLTQCSAHWMAGPLTTMYPADHFQLDIMVSAHSLIWPQQNQLTLEISNIKFLLKKILLDYLPSESVFI